MKDGELAIADTGGAGVSSKESISRLAVASVFKRGTFVKILAYLAVGSKVLSTRNEEEAMCSFTRQTVSKLELEIRAKGLQDGRRGTASTWA